MPHCFKRRRFWIAERERERSVYERASCWDALRMMPSWAVVVGLGSGVRDTFILVSTGWTVRNRAKRGGGANAFGMMGFFKVRDGF